MYIMPMEKTFADRLKKILILAVVLNLLIIIMQGFSSIKTIENSRKGLMLVGRTALSSFEGGRRAHLLLNPSNAVRFRQFLESIGSDTGVKSLYLFDQNGHMLFSTRQIEPPVIHPDQSANGSINTDAGLFMYHTLPAGRPMMEGMMGQGRNRRTFDDDQLLVAGVMLDTSGHKALVRSEIIFMTGMLALEALLIAVYIYVARILRAYADQSRRLEASEREAELGKMSQVMAHELKNPLSTLKGLMEFSAKKAEGELKEISTSCVDEIARLDRIINDYLSYGKDMTLNISEADIRSISENTMKLLQIDAEQKQLTISISGQKTVQADPEKMRQVIFNLLINAVQGSPSGSWIDIDITDSVLTISNQIADRDFEQDDLGKPFYTTKTVGTGLGLAIVKRIVQLHGFKCDIIVDDKFTVEIKY